jgi:hypothetical protein
VRGAITAALLTLAVPAAAQERPSSVAMTCAQAAALVSARGTLVLGTGGLTYDRFVRDRHFCESSEITERALAPTRDDPQCFVGYRCREPNREPTGQN